MAKKFGKSGGMIGKSSNGGLMTSKGKGTPKLVATPSNMKAIAK